MEKDMEYYVKISGQVIAKNLQRRKHLTEDIIKKYQLSDKKDICIVASGSSLNGAMMAQSFMNKYIGCDVMAISPTDYLDYKKDFVKNRFIILISQSGCSTNIIEAAKDLNNDNIDYVALTGNLKGDLKDYAKTLVEYGVGNEIIDYVTLGLTTLVEFLMLFALEIANINKNIQTKEYNILLEQIGQCSVESEKIFEKSVEFTKREYENLFKMDRAFIVTDGPNMATAREGSLKFGETLKIPTLYYENEEYVHGPNMQLDPEYTVFFIDTNTKNNRMQDVYQATKLITEHTYMITNKDIKEDDKVIKVESNIIPELTPLFLVVPFQYISAHVTKEKNNFKCHPLFDKFEEKIHCKTDDYDEIMKEKIKKDKELEEKYVLASHGHMAEGIKSTLEIIVGPQEDLICINAYTKECQDPLPEFKKIIENNPEDDIVFMTDMFGGSVNNNAMVLTKNPKVHVVTGINLAVVISIIMSDQNADTEEIIKHAVEQSKELIMYCNELASNEDEEDEF